MIDIDEIERSLLDHAKGGPGSCYVSWPLDMANLIRCYKNQREAFNQVCRDYDDIQKLLFDTQDKLQKNQEFKLIPGRKGEEESG